MSGVSGCFGQTKPDTIDNAAEVSAAVDDIMGGAGAQADNSQAAFVMAQHYAFMEQRVRMLTWAVVALAAVLVMKEL